MDRDYTEADNDIESKSRHKGKRILLMFISCIFLIALGILAFYATEEGWSTGDGTSSTFPVADFAEDEPSESTVASFPGNIPDYDGNDTVILNNNKPNFTEYDIGHISGENFAELDSLGRCGAAFARLDRSMMPNGKRGDIGDIRPTGWVQKKYPGIVDSDPPYLYNRSHLIAHALTGQDANKQNLITGTRYLNATLMLPYEEQVMKYLDHSDNHVLYRVTPYFKGRELLARGVEMEAYSIEDNGEGVCYHVYIYNVQPGIELDYSTGKNWREH